MKKKVLIGMSGGVDSSVAAALLLEEGYDVTGVTMKLWEGDAKDGCTSISAVSDAKKVADKLGIEHITVDFTEKFKKLVVDYFANEYMQGRTPNPCVMCNETVKFGLMYDEAMARGFDFVATGHYADKVFKDGRFYLRRSKAGRKDQTYFLCRLKSEVIEKVLFPLKDFETKDEIREIAEKYGLVTADKKDSQDICFISNESYIDFIKREYDARLKKGDFIDTNGKVIGKHEGILNYTIGQRKGLGAFGKPMFVKKIDANSNNVVLGEKGEEYSDGVKVKLCEASDINKLTGCNATVKIRYAAPCVAFDKISIDGDVATVIFTEKQRAVTPGQSAVFYEDDVLIAGGEIIDAI